MLTMDNSCLVIVDIQGKLAHLMHEKEVLFDNAQKLIRGVQALDIPILWLEQNPKGLGPTIPEIAELLSDLRPIEKMSFSGCGNEMFMQRLRALDRSQVLIAGIETHICVFQTASELSALGYGVQVVADAVSSRTLANKTIGLEKMRSSGVGVTSVETALFELLKMGKGEKFKEILTIVK